jgi:hypothetical protein
MSQADDLFDPLIDAVTCAMAMREAQKRYFSSGPTNKREALIASKELERKFDRMTHDLAAQIQERRALQSSP